MSRLVLAVALIGVGLAYGSRASAHAFDPAVLELRELPDGLGDLSLRVPSAVAARAADGLAPLLPERCRITAPPSPDIASAWRVDCGASGLHGLALGVRGLDAARAEVIVHLLFLDGSELAGALHGDADRFTIPPAAQPASSRAVLSGYLRMGVVHILGGFDHLLFLVGLLLLVRSPRALLATVTAFTVAHSVTLALAATGHLVLPQPPVEVLIAASILLLALELARPMRASGDAHSPSLLARAPALAALCFGLLHGLGFAAALTEAGLPADRAPLALVGFNVGVELGQLAVVIALLLPVRWWRRRGEREPRASVIRLAPAYALGAISMAWLIERTGTLLSTANAGGAL